MGGQICFYYYFMVFLLCAIVNKESQRGNDMSFGLYHLYIQLFDGYCSQRSNFQLYNAAA